MGAGDWNISMFSVTVVFARSKTPLKQVVFLVFLEDCRSILSGLSGSPGGLEGLRRGICDALKMLVMGPPQ